MIAVPRRSWRWRAVTALLTTVVMPACGGGGGGGGGGPTEPSPGITFSPGGAASSDSLSLQLEGTPTASSLTLRLEARDVAALYGVAFDLGYPAAVLRLDEVREGTLLGTGGAPTAFQVAEPTPGTVVVGLSRLGDVPPATGTGTVLTFRFTALAAGNGALAFSSARAFDAFGGVRAVTWVGGSVSVVR